MSDRELLLIGAVLYWAEGGKSKPWSRREWLEFINSDPDVIRLFLAWLRSVGVPSERVTYRVSIHETADVRAAERFWADIVGITPEDLQRTTLKRHVAKTVRKNTGTIITGAWWSESASQRGITGAWKISGGLLYAASRRAVVPRKTRGRYRCSRVTRCPN